MYRTLSQGEDPAKFNEYKFEKQFIKYSQVLDTDYDNFMLAYSCQENALWEDAKSGRELDFDEVFRAYINQAEASGGLDASKSLYASENFSDLKGIKKTLIHKQKIHIFTRPKIADDGAHRHQSFDNMHLSLLLNDVSTKYLPKDFGQQVLDTFYSKMVHDDTCDYNPYAVEAYYQAVVSQREEAERAAAEEAEQKKKAEEPDHEEL